MSDGIEDILAELASLPAGMGSGYDPYDLYLPGGMSGSDVIIAGAPELTGVELTEAQWMPTLPEEAKPAPDVTAKDILVTYNEMSDEERQSVNEQLFSAGFYGSNDPDVMVDVDRGLNALGYAINYYATQGVTPFDGLPDADTSKFVKQGPSIRRATEAQINALADSAAGNLLGRNATAEERQLAMSVIRSLETSSSVSPSQADVESAFAEAAPQEVAARGSEKALKVFESIVRGG